MNEAEDLEQALTEAMRRPLGSPVVPLHFQPSPSPTYWVTLHAYEDVQVRGLPRFEDGDLTFSDAGRVVRAFARGTWISIDIVEDQ